MKRMNLNLKMRMNLNLMMNLMNLPKRMNPMEIRLMPCPFRPDWRVPD